MNKNTFIGILLIGVILLGFGWFNNKQYEEKAELQRKEQAKADSIQKAWEAANPVVKDTVASIVAQEGAENAVRDTTSLGKRKEGVETFKTLENDVMKIKFSNLGGKIAEVELKDYERLYDKSHGDPLVLFFPNGTNFGLEFYTPEKVNTNEYYFEPIVISNNQIAYRLYADSTSYLEYVYTLSDNYMMDFSVDLSHFKKQIVTNQSEMVLNWSVLSPQEEKGFKNENNYTTIAYKYPNNSDVEELAANTGEETEGITTQVQWVAFKQQFFSSIIIAKNNFTNANIGYKTFQPNDNFIKEFEAAFSLPYTPATNGYDFNFYFGPNKYSTLKEYGDLELQKLVPLGWGIIGWVNKWLIIPTFDLLGNHIASMGIIILLLTIFIKIIILPLTYKSYLSSAKMRLLKPDLEKINAKYPKKDDAMKKQQAIMALYKSAGVSPMGGCLPMLIQFPILFAMFRFFPSSIELRGKSFLWADDLSSYDSIWTFPDGFSIPFYGDHVSLFTILMAASLYLTSRINMNQQPGGQTMPGMKFMMLYMMPVMMLFIFNDFSSGLSYYYFLANVITLIQMYAMRYLVNEDKLHAKMKAQSAKPVKQSKWAAKLAEMQKAAEAQQKARK